MKKICTLLLCGFFVFVAPAFAKAQSTNPPVRQCDRAAAAGPSLYVWDADNLAVTKSRVAAGEASVKPAMKALIKAADKALTNPPYSVTAKTKTPPSGSKHDYYSIGPYWWPDPKKEDGLPYIRKDGKTNPERYDDSFDSDRMSGFADDVQALAIAGYFTGNTAYSKKAAELLRTWFITPETKMNPNLNYAQAIPGKTEGRGIGIIDTYRLVRVVDSIGLLSHAGQLTTQEVNTLKDWFGDYSLWMLTSENGKEERAALNNHGVYFDAQLGMFAAFAGDQKAVKFVTEGITKSRIPGQITKKGKLPLELKRTRPFHYTAFTLQAFFDIGDLGECAGIDVWNYENFKGQSIKRAMDFQTGYAGRLSDWPYKEIRTINPRGFYQNLRRAADAYDDPSYKKAMRFYDERYKDDISVLLYPVK